jgi:hypothetical protein
MKDKELEIACCFCGQGLPFNKAIEMTIKIDFVVMRYKRFTLTPIALTKFYIKVYREDLI